MTMTRIKDLRDQNSIRALAAVEAGADYLGFNFFPKSVRFIELHEFIEIASVMKKEQPSIKLVGVFVNSSVDEIRSLSNRPFGSGAVAR